MADNEPSVKNGPPATTGKNPGKGGAGVLTKPAGPLPVYGWLAVGVAAIFLYRKLYAAPAPAATGSAASGDGSGGGVFIIPGAGSSPAPTGPAPTHVVDGNGSTVPVQTAVDAIVNQRQQDAKPLTAAGRQYLTMLGSLPADKRQGAIQFAQQNDARRSLGLTYFKGTNSQGIPVLYDPVTHNQALLNTSGIKKG